MEELGSPMPRSSREDLIAALSPLLDRALELPAAERAEWLENLRPGQPELIAELEALLAREAELDAQGFLEGDIWSELPIARPSLAERRIGAYTLDRPLGRGGMGTVWLAHRSDGRYEGMAAVKLLNLALLDPVGSERFRREGTLLARLSHPNIARLIDAGVTAEGQPYLVLEYVEGTRIDRYCDERRLPPERRLQLFLQVLDAVGLAHSNLIVHRDLKPSNILVTADGDVKLLDFGIAKLIETEGDGGDGPALTMLGGPALTPEYAAPEQALGGPITTATDGYALGVLLYLLLAGRHPTGAGCRSAAEHLHAITDTEPPRLSAAVTTADPANPAAAQQAAEARAATPDRLRRTYGGDLDNIVAKALKKDPLERYQSVAAFAEDLRRYLHHEPVSARPDTLRYRAQKFARRNRAPLAVAAAVVLLIASAGFRERQLRGRAEAEARKSSAVEQYLIGVFGAADPFAPPGSRPADVSARALLDRGVAGIDTTLADQPDVRAELRGALGRVYMNLGLYGEAETQLRRSLEERQALYGAEHAEVAAAMDQLGVVLDDQGRLPAADSMLRGALAQRRRLLGDRSEATAESLMHIASMQVEQSRFDSADSLYQEALQIRRELHGDGSLEVAEAEHWLAETRCRQGHCDESLALFQRALVTRERELGPEHPTTAETLTRLASAEELLGKYTDAEMHYRRALAIQRKALGPEHPAVANTLNSLGQMLFKVPRPDEAESLLRQALAINRKVLGEQSEPVSANIANLALIVRDRGDLDEAERLLQRSLVIDRALYGPEDMRIGFDLNELAVVMRLNGRSEAAIPVLREARTMVSHLVSPTEPGALAVTGHLATALRETGRLEEAEALFRDVLARLDTTNVNAQLMAIPYRVRLGRTLTATGRAAEALPMLESGLAMARTRFGDADWRTAEAMMGLGDCLVALRRYDRAGPLLLEAHASLDRQRKAQPRMAEQADDALARFQRIGKG